MTERVAVVRWQPRDETSAAIKKSLTDLGYEAVPFYFDESVPLGADVVFSFAPYGRLAPICRQLQQMPSWKRPFLIHWNTENPPDLRMPWRLLFPVASLRAWFDRLQDDRRALIRRALGTPLFAWVNRRMHKFRYVGEYHYYYHRGVLKLLVESSSLYAALHRQHGVEALCVPWGTIDEWYGDLGLERDIDVLWIGNRRSARRSRNIDRVRRELAQRGIAMHVVDNVENPFVFGSERLHLLNRSKITLNLLPTWYDHAFPYRFHLAAPNRSLVVSEPILSHCVRYQAGVHFLATPVQGLATTIGDCLEGQSGWQGIIDAAYQLTTQEMTFRSSVSAIMREYERMSLTQ